jgi:UPF0271 protein
MGESFGASDLDHDTVILDSVTSVNIACGFHAGDPTTMRRTIRAAQERGVAIGAHPGLPDLAGFGRRRMDITRQEAFDLVAYQIGALSALAKAEGAPLRHVKAHGALYNMAATDAALAAAIAEAVYAIDPALVLYGLAGSQLIAAGRRVGLRTASEVFADRSYLRDGTLAPRSQPGSVIADADQAIRQAVHLAMTGQVATLPDGDPITVEAQTLCIHSDTPHAADHARQIRTALEAAGVAVRAISS